MRVGEDIHDGYNGFDHDNSNHDIDEDNDDVGINEDNTDDATKYGDTPMMTMMMLIRVDIDEFRYDDVGDEYDNIQIVSRCEDDI